MTTTTKTRTRKPAPKPERKATLQTIGNVRVLWITCGKLTLAYQLTRLDSQLGGVAFQLRKAHQGGEHQPETYSVLINGTNTSCDCAGHSFHGHCKHVDGINALIAAGKIEMPQNKPAAVPVMVNAEEPMARLLLGGESHRQAMAAPKQPALCPLCDRRPCVEGETLCNDCLNPF